MADPDETLVEAVARAMCVAINRDPDQMTYHYNGDVEEPHGPLWLAWAPQAHAVLALPRIAAALELADATHAAEAAWNAFEADEVTYQVFEYAQGCRTRAYDAYRATLEAGNG
jgi:hypothetical protein